MYNQVNWMIQMNLQIFAKELLYSLQLQAVNNREFSCFKLKLVVKMN